MNLSELLVDLTTHYNALIRSSASKVNLTTSQVFHIISLPHGGISMSKLAHRLGLDASTLTRNIQKLEKLWHQTQAQLTAPRPTPPPPKWCCYFNT